MANGIAKCIDSSMHFDGLHHIDWSRRLFDYRNLADALPRARQVMAEGGYDIVHVHTPIAAFVSRMALAGKFPGKRPALIYTVHGFHFQATNGVVSNLTFASLEKLAGRWTDRLITINREDQMAARRLRIVPPDRIHYIPGIGVDVDFFRPAAVPSSEIESVRNRLGVPPGDPVFTVIAEFLPRKRHRDAVAALQYMKHRNAHMIFVGEGRELNSVRALGIEAGLADRLHFVGNQDDVRPFILAARATVLPSTQEGLPRSIMESFACGVPVTASDIRGNRDLVGDGGGLVFPAGDAGALAAHLDWFCANAVKAAEMGAAARTSIGPYGIGNILRLHEDLYRDVVQCSAESVGTNVLVRGAQ